MNITKTVYSLYWPETRLVVDELWKSCPHDLYTEPYTKKQDKEHITFLEKWKEWSGLNMDGFNYAYPTHGASEAITHILASCPKTTKLHVIEGEYEGYQRIAEAFGLRVVVSERLDDITRAAVADDIVMLSTPSAIDGRAWSMVLALTTG
jgi:histidinol-phosphate/aromatic aminotransferase/cobyric acid decarboxylase-like protein